MSDDSRPHRFCELNRSQASSWGREAVVLSPVIELHGFAAMGFDILVSWHIHCLTCRRECDLVTGELNGGRAMENPVRYPTAAHSVSFRIEFTVLQSSSCNSSSPPSSLLPSSSLARPPLPFWRPGSPWPATEPMVNPAAMWGPLYSASVLRYHCQLVLAEESALPHAP
ncbi:unnamed protein product [Somion occarium]|uniref:Uncharacterized protein n=1 Tax=Somion occarium TaxID=3059160 RepID=A0ABP1DKD6_9APHY